MASGDFLFTFCGFVLWFCFCLCEGVVFILLDCLCCLACGGFA